jgi:4-carboxymuconolactone decarboxylase
LPPILARDMDGPPVIFWGVAHGRGTEIKRTEAKVLSRIQLAPLSEMTPEQKQVHDEAVQGRRGHAPAPIIAWLRTPEFARRAQKLGEFLRYETSLPPRLSELAILITARFWTAHYEWRAHKQEALKAGVNPDVVAAIASRRRPEFSTDKEAAVYEIATSLLNSGLVPEAVYRQGVAVLGEKAVVELVGLLGYYTLVSFTLNAFEINLPEAIEPELLDKGGGK